MIAAVTADAVAAVAGIGTEAADADATPSAAEADPTPKAAGELAETVIKVVVAGSEGRMGSETCRAVQGADDMELVGRSDTALAVSVGEILDGAAADVLVDFTTPDSALSNIEEAVSRGVHAVVGTTGFDHSKLDAMTGANVLIAPNFAIGALLMMRFAEEAMRWMKSAEIVELHHPGKLDSPSGTAALTAARMASVDSQGSSDGVPIHSIRLPGLVAHQEVILGSEGETLTIRHDSIDRICFMSGVLAAIRGVGSIECSPLVGLDRLLWPEG